MQYNTTTVSNFLFPHNISTTTSTPTTTTRLSFATRPIKKQPVFKTRAMVNETFVGSATQTSFYDLLGIPETGSLPDIKLAYKQLARVYHPDVSPPERVKEHTELFIRVREAYETLLDPRKRAVYDCGSDYGVSIAFSATTENVYDYDQESRDRREWRSQCQSPVSESKMRSTGKDSRGSSWGNRMRRHRK